MDTLECMRRERPDVCRHCGWNMVMMEEQYECMNDKCLRPRRRTMTFDQECLWNEQQASTKVAEEGSSA